MPFLALLAFQLLRQREYYLATNSTAPKSLVATLAPGQSLCAPQVDVPGGAARVRVAFLTHEPRPPLAVTVALPGLPLSRGALAAGPRTRRITAEVPLAPLVAAHPPSRRGTVCIRIGGRLPLQFAGTAGLRAGEAPPTIDGRPVAAQISLWILPRAGSSRSLIQAWPDVMQRLALFRPGFAGPVFYWLLFLVGLPAIAYAAIRLLAVAELPGRRLGLGVALVALACAASWALTTVAFDSPDESEHFAYTQSLVETGHAPDAGPSARAPYSSDEVRALYAIHHFGTIEDARARPPWEQTDVRAWRALGALHLPRDDGGGYSVATNAHSPVYYSLLAPGYLLGRAKGAFTELFWMRLISALLGAVVALCAYGLMRELVPPWPSLAVGAGLLVGLLPMFGFIAGAVNNDNGVNAAAAVLIYLVVRALRRGLTWRLGLALGLVAELVPLMKGTGYALFPAAILAFVAIAARMRTRRALVAVAVAVGSFGATALLWRALAGGFHRGAAPLPGGTSGATSVATNALGSKLVYLWEVFFPRLPGMRRHWEPGQWPFYDIYVRRGFGAFGWNSIYFPAWVYELIVGVVAALAGLAVGFALGAQRLLRAHWREAAYLALTILGVVAAVEYVFYFPRPRPQLQLAEEGRYAFTAIAPLACLALAGLLGLPRRHAGVLLTVLVTAMAALTIAARLLYVTANYT